MTFDTLYQNAYWYTDTTINTGLEAGAYSFNMYFNELPRPWWNSTYNSRERINISAGSSAIPSEYPVKLTLNHAQMVTDSKSQSDGDDIRIAYWTGSAWSEVNRTLGDGSSWNSASTTILFKTQASIAASGFDNDHYLYYNNTGAASPPTNTPSARYYLAESLAETQTSSTAYSNKVQLQFTPSDESEHWVIVATWRQRHVGSLGAQRDLGQARITVNAAARTGTDLITYRMSGNVWQAQGAFLRINGTTAQQTIGIDFRAVGGTDGIDNARILAFMIPDPSSADIQYAEDLARTNDTANPTESLNLTFTPSSAGDYLWMVNGFHHEGPGGTSAGGLFAQDETSTDQQSSQETYLSSTSVGFKPLVHFEQRTLAASSQSFIIRFQPDTTPGSERQGLTQLLFRSDVFEGVETADSAGQSTTSSTSYQTKVSLTTASQSSNRDYVYLVVMMHDDASGGNINNASFGQIRLAGTQQLEAEHAIARSSYNTQIAWGYAETNTGSRAIDARFRAEFSSVTAEAQYAHILALRYKEPTLTLGGEEEDGMKLTVSVYHT
ncbi:MAG: hypothetical protein GTO22_00280, partial [Gemmatimonadales bacterium]|nr:hypothetical protein [Gemmatimonadales bacterium]